ncbi:MAG: hypothetical protein HFF17_11225 [Oscillospiraceae bacterium]|nr:hypothetical protein [Oscillospiraceae bacterium]
MDGCFERIQIALMKQGPVTHIAGSGAAIGAYIEGRPGRFPHTEVNVACSAWRLGIPATCRIATGEATGRDFRAMCQSVS